MIYTHPISQIHPNSNFGKALRKTTEQSETIVETGTLMGLGSTWCIAQGLVRSSQRLFTFETDPYLCLVATALYLRDPRVRCLPIPIEEWADNLPKIDFAFLDSSDQAADSELNLVIKQARFIGLDDTDKSDYDAPPKHAKSKARLLEAGWIPIHNEPDTRNGEFIAERPC